MNTQTQKATQELSDAQLESISGGCYKRYDDNCYEEKRHCERDYDSEDKNYCSSDSDYGSDYESSCDSDYEYNSCHERRRRRHHGCR